MLNTGYNGLLGVLILIGDVWAIINIAQSSATNGKKLLWILLVLLLPSLVYWPSSIGKEVEQSVKGDGFSVVRAHQSR